MAMASDPYVPPKAAILNALQQLFLPLMTRAPDAVVICNACSVREPSIRIWTI
jgi:hypothetical protein